MSLTPTESRTVIATLAAIAMTVLAPGDTARADVLGCDDANRRCIDDLYFASCAERGTTRETCEALGREAEGVWTATRTTTAGELLGLVYYELAHVARRADDESVERSYLDRARAVYLAIVDADEGSAVAYSMMAVLDSEDPELRVAWLRKAVAVDPDQANVQFLTSALMNQGTEDAFVEAIDVLQDQYDAAPPGSDKWQWAAAIHNQLSFAELAFDFPVDPGALAELQTRVRRDSDWDEVLAVLSSPSAHAEDIESALETACRLRAFFGTEPCIGGIERTVLAAREPSEGNAQVLADAAARGIRLAPSAGMIADEELQATRRQLAVWLTEFADFGLDSVPVLEVIGRMSETRDRWTEVRQEIVRREPGNGEARFQLGVTFYASERWAEAIDELERARELLPEDERYQVNTYLREARYELEASRSLTQ